MKQRVIAHIDMDAFFAAIEQRDNPGLAGKPVIVGADPKGGSGRGVVSTCSYEARPYGIHSAMPISQAYRLCPHGIYVRGRHAKYKEVSRQIFSILLEFTPEIQPVSIDEAFLDISGSYHFYKTPYKTCLAIKERIRKETMLNASIGIAPNKMTAKIASDHCKPDGLLEITQEAVQTFLWALPISKLWGVGKKTQGALNGLGISTIGDLAQTPLAQLTEIFGKHGRHLYELAHGIDDRGVEADEEIKSVSHEHTYDDDTSDIDEIYDTISILSEKVSRRLRKYGLKGKTLTLKVRLKGFKTYTRARTLPERFNFSDVIFKNALQLFEEWHKKGDMIRLIGVRVSNFRDDYVRDNLFSDPRQEKQEEIHKALDHIKDKFGERSIRRGVYKNYDR